MGFIKNRKTAVFGMLMTALLWSTGGFLIKMVSGNPFAISSGRSGIAAIVMLVYVRFKLIKPTKQIILGAIFYGITVIGFVVANKLTTAANCILLQYISPVWVAVLSSIFLKDKLRSVDYISIATILIGLQLFFLDSLSSGMLLGNIIGIIISFSFAAFFVVAKTIPDEGIIYSAIYGNIFTSLIGIPFFSIELIKGINLIGILLLGAFQVGLAYILYSKSMPYLKALDAILIPIIEPLLNPVWVLLITGEKPSLLTIIGGVIVISSVAFRSLYYRYKGIN